MTEQDDFYLQDVLEEGARIREKDRMLGQLLSRFFWSPPNITEVHLEPLAGQAPFLFIHGQVELTAEELDLLKQLHAEHEPAPLELDDAVTYGRTVITEQDGYTLHELADEPERSDQ